MTTNNRLSIAADYALDIQGAEIGVSRATGETDADYRARLQRILFSRPRWYHLVWWWVCALVEKVTK
jgi:hypothetical protein